MDPSVVLRLRSVSPFTPRGMRSYSGSAAALEEEAVQATFSSPPRGLPVSPVAYRFGLPTVGRRRALTGHGLGPFSPGGDTRHPHGRLRQSACPEVGREVRTLVSASSRGGDWRTMQAENAVSRSHLAWPLRHGVFSGPPGDTALAAYPCGSCRVRARCSVQVRSRTGRLW